MSSGNTLKIALNLSKAPEELFKADSDAFIDDDDNTLDAETPTPNPGNIRGMRQRNCHSENNPTINNLMKTIDIHGLRTAYQRLSYSASNVNNVLENEQLKSLQQRLFEDTGIEKVMGIPKKDHSTVIKSQPTRRFNFLSQTRSNAVDDIFESKPMNELLTTGYYLSESFTNLHHTPNSTISPTEKQHLIFEVKIHATDTVFESQNLFTIYLLNVKDNKNNQEFTLGRRYRHFFDLHQKLYKILGPNKVPPISPKRIFGKMQTESISVRKENFQFFLNTVISSLDNSVPSAKAEAMIREFLNPLERIYMKALIDSEKEGFLMVSGILAQNFSNQTANLNLVLPKQKSGSFLRRKNSFLRILPSSNENKLLNTTAQKKIKRMWFVLKDQVLYSFKFHDESAPYFVLNLMYCVLEIVDKERFMIKITPCWENALPLILFASSFDEMISWIVALKKNEPQTTLDSVPADSTFGEITTFDKMRLYPEQRKQENSDSSYPEYINTEPGNKDSAEYEKMHNLCTNIAPGFQKRNVRTLTVRFEQKNLDEMILNHQEIQTRRRKNSINDMEVMKKVKGYFYPPDRVNENIVFKALSENVTRIKAGTVNQLYAKLLNGTLSGSEHGLFVSAFLLTYRSFSSPEELFDRLEKADTATSKYVIADPLEVEHTSPQILKENNEKISLPVIKLRVCNIISKWLHIHFYDFLEFTGLVDRLKYLVETKYSNDPQISNKLRVAIKKQFTKHKARCEDDTDENVPEPILPRFFQFPKTVDFNFLDLDPLELARQLALVEFELFRFIQPIECLDQNWNRSNKEELAPNLMACIRMFNRLSAISATIIVQTKDLLPRVNYLSYWITVAEKCLQINDMAGVIAIISGLESSPVYRLRQTWTNLPSKKMQLFERLKSLMNPQNNFKSYRNNLKNAALPCVPYLGIFLTDLTMIEDGNPSTLNNGMINFEKNFQISSVIQQIQYFQQKPFNFRMIPRIRDFILQQHPNTEHEAYKLSLLCEPRKSKQ